MRLSLIDQQKALDYIIEQGRSLEKAWAQKFQTGFWEEEVIRALVGFHNVDGGFGNGLEADIRLPASSPIATTIGLQHLERLDHLQSAQEMIQKAISYLESSFDKINERWYAVPRAVNDYPHAFWWKVYDNGLSWIDHHWGNPSAEIIGYLHKYKHYVKDLPVDSLTDKALHHLKALTSFESEHEVYCYVRFFRMHPDLLTPPVKRQMKKAVNQLVHTKPSDWKNYVPMPLKFVPSPDSPNYGMLHRNLDYFVHQLTHDHFIEPSWEWNDYLEDWEQAKREWSAVLTLEALEYLELFDRLER
ncbi:hypothetical protein [Thalassobacillus pellis]|uniref:hypothetical protein n=1 Tax=Thalassobacillus pellis TaxID=748008 RepID=UPI001961A4B0|nr:hypothetical protein [Thalassobacillus pellis]MBM7551867.1 hypothetical protein [Thalassobacillus pellis]